MKKAILFRHTFLFFFVAGLLTFSQNKAESQAITDTINGPYQDGGVT